MWLCYGETLRYNPRSDFSILQEGTCICELWFVALKLKKIIILMLTKTSLEASQCHKISGERNSYRDGLKLNILFTDKTITVTQQEAFS